VCGAHVFQCAPAQSSMLKLEKQSGILDVLESLFDFYFVEPAKAAQRKAELNEKLKEPGKPTI
jgi:hypothetical protein